MRRWPIPCRPSFRADDARPALASGLLALAAILSTGPAIAALLWASQTVSLGAALAAALALALIVLAAGRLLLRIAGVPGAQLPAAWVVGTIASACVLHLLVAVSGMLAVYALIIWAGLLGVATAWRSADRAAAAPGTATDIAALVVCSAATLYWCWRLAEVPVGIDHDGVITTWVDQFIHAAQISQFGDPRASGAGAVELAGAPRPLYHYASYLLPAAFVQPLDLPGLPLAVALWVPLGFLTLCAGIYALGSALAGPAGGFASLAVLTALPDAASYGLMNRAFGYYWLMLQVPGGAYAGGACLASLALWLRWTQTGSRRALAVSGLLVLACVFVRVHFFLLAFPAWLVAVVLESRRLAGYRLAALAAGAVAFALFVLGYYRIVPGATPALAEFLHVIYEVHPTLPLAIGYAELARDYGATLGLIGGILLLVPAALGVFVLLYPLSLIALKRVRPLRATDGVPAVLLACYLLLVVAAPIAPNGDATEFPHRPFVLLYAVFAIWTAGGFATWLAAVARADAARAWAYGIAFVVVAGAWAALFTAPDARWDEYFWLEPGVPQAGHFIRAHSVPGDVLAVQNLDTRRVATDAAIQLVALSGVPAYLSRPFIHATRGRTEKALAERRYAQLRHIAAETDARRALEAVRRLGVRWYVVPGGGPGWDPERRRAALAVGNMAVYRVGPGGPDAQ